MVFIHSYYMYVYSVHEGVHVSLLDLFRWYKERKINRNQYYYTYTYTSVYMYALGAKY